MTAPADFPFDAIHTAVELALASRHRSVSRADARQEAYLAVLEAQAAGGDVDVPEVARRAVTRLVTRERSAGTGAWPERPPHLRLDYGWEDEVHRYGAAREATWTPTVPSAEDEALEDPEADWDAALDALEDLDPTVRRWLELLLLEGVNAYTAARRVGIGTNAAQRLLQAAQLTETGARLGLTGGRPGDAPVGLVGLVGLDARGKAA